MFTGTRGALLQANTVRSARKPHCRRAVATTRPVPRPEVHCGHPPAGPGSAVEVGAEGLRFALVATPWIATLTWPWRCTGKLRTLSREPGGGLSLSKLAQRLDHNLEALRNDRSHLISNDTMEGWQSG